MAKPRSFVATVLLLFTFLPIASMGLIAQVSAAPPSITLTDPRDISGSPTKAVYADVAVDTDGKVHVAWLEYSADNSSSRVLYTNNVNGSYFSAYEVAGGGGTNAEHIVAIAVESNRVHVFFTSSDKSMRHRIVNLTNGSPTRAEITRLSPGNAKGYAPTATIDSTGRVHAAWIDNRSGTYQIYHRIWSNGSWEGSDRAVRAGGQQDRPSLAATSDGRVHVLYVSGPSPQYAIFNGSWQQSNAPGGGGKSSNATGLAADGNRVYAVWSITRSDNVHVVNYNQGENGNWGSARVISRDGEFSDNPSIGFSNGKAYAIWTSGNSRVPAYREIDPNGDMSDVTNIGRGPSNWPMAHGSSGGVAFVWQDKSSGQEEVIVASASGARPIKPIGSIAVTSEFAPLLGGVGVVGTFDVTVTRSTNGGPATSVTLRPEGGDAKTESFSGDSATITGLSFSTPAKACEVRTIRGTLTGPGGTSDEFSAQVWVDRAVDASATIIDSSGDPAYARDSFNLQIASGPDECSGLTSYSVDFPNSTANPDASGTFTIPTGATVGVTLPEGNDGTYAFDVKVIDKADHDGSGPGTGNVATYSLSIIKDTTAPVARLTSGQAIPATELPLDGFVNLNLSGLTAEDNLYDRGDKDFYSVELVTKLTSGGLPTLAEWTNRGVEVVAPVPATLQWNAGMGLIGDFTPGGDYTVYVRVRDGAGNPSLEVFPIDKSIRIDQLNGRLFLPSLHK